MIRRTGDTLTKIRLILHLQQHHEQFRVLPDLGRKPTSIHTSSHQMISLAGNILGIKEESRAGVIQTLWTYIKTNNLQDKVDRKRIHADAALRPVRVPKRVTRYFARADKPSLVDHDVGAISSVPCIKNAILAVFRRRYLKFHPDLVSL